MDEKELLHTIIHEELEARIIKRAYNAESEEYRKKFMKLLQGGDEKVHPYIDKVVNRYFRLRGL